MNKAVDEWPMIDVIEIEKLFALLGNGGFRATFAGGIEDMDL